MTKVIKLLKPGSMGSFKGWVTEDKNINPVFVASFKYPNEPKVIDMYGKIYSLDIADRSIFNEIIGYLVADALGIPQPKYAGIAMISTADFIKNDTIGFSDTSLGKEFLSFPYFPIFCTAKINKSETAFTYHEKTKKLLTDIAKWKDISKAMAMDNTIAHIDRHVRNILRTGKSSYHVIDNGRLVDFHGNSGWLVSDLIPNKKYDNLLFNLASQYFSPTVFTKVKSGMVHESQCHDTAIASIIDEANAWINILYNKSPNDYNAFMQFLSSRATKAIAQSTSRVELLI